MGIFKEYGSYWDTIIYIYIYIMYIYMHRDIVFGEQCFFLPPDHRIARTEDQNWRHLLIGFHETWSGWNGAHKVIALDR